MNICEIHIGSVGQDIAGTNYWESELAAAGIFYLSWCAGAARLLVPDNQTYTLDEMRSAKSVVISRGPWTAQDGQDCLELLFEDHSIAPFAIQMSALQCSRMSPDVVQKGTFPVIVWSRHRKALQLPGNYRVVKSVPCLEEWLSK